MEMMRDVKLTKKPLRGVPVGGIVRLPRMQARAIVAAKLGVYVDRAVAPEPEPASEPVEEISPRTGKPKRRYKRRDMQAER